MVVIEFLRMNWGWILSLSTVLITGATYIYTKLHALELGVQALLRAQMIDGYYKYKDAGEVPLNVKENFENLWVQYEKLGKNGVMSDIHKEFMLLRTVSH